MSSEATPKVHPNIYSELLQLSKSLTPWQNEILRCVFKKGEWSQTDKSKILQFALAFYGLEKESESLTSLMLSAGDMPSPPAPGQQIKLRGVLNLTNVNALKNDQRIRIGNQLSIIYGENATGKSGYARVMKKAFRARVVEKILPNVYSKTPPPGPASAIFEIEEKLEEKDVVRQEVWTDGAEPVECLGRFAVFDSKCGRIYLTADSQLSFLPYGFDILADLTTATDEIKAELKGIGQKTAPKADALKLLIDDTAIGTFIASLTAASEEKEIELKAAWSESDAALLVTKEAELAQLKLKTPEAVRASQEKLKKNLEKVKSEISKVAIAISATEAEAIKKKYVDLTTFTQAVEAATKAAFADIELVGVGTPTWQELIRAAAKYSTEGAYPGQPFPATQEGAKCVLCQQTLDNQAQDRLKRFWVFIQNEMSSKRDQARDALALVNEVLMKLPREIPPVLEAFLEPLRANGSKVPKEIEAYFPLAVKRITSLENAIADNSWGTLASEPLSPSAACDVEIKAVDKKLSDLVDDGKMSALIETVSKDIDELKARIRFSKNLSVVLEHVRALKRSKAHSDAAAKITTNTLTKMANDLHKKLVTDEFKNGVQDQLKAIGLLKGKAGVSEKPQKGKVLNKIAVVDAPTVNPEEVFSEGERTAVALACFAAELTANKDNCAIILDDPVSSLDRQARKGVATLLVSESTKRQVIIFTHDLVFYRELISIATRESVDVCFQHIQSLGENFGLVSGIPPWYAMTVAQRITLLEQNLGEAKALEAAGDIAVYTSRCRDFYDILRSAWERSVEELLFNNVVQRLEPEVATQSLRGVSVDEEAIEAVFDGMTRSSTMIDAHDPAMAKGKTLASLADLQNDLQDLKTFKNTQTKKSKELEEKLKYLKKSKAGK